MEEQHRTEIKINIENKILRLKNDISELKELTKPISPDNAIGRISRMDAINNKSVAEAGLRQREEQLKKLEFASKKFDDADFGKCIRCGAEIPFQRLALMPESNKCVQCAAM